MLKLVFQVIFSLILAGSLGAQLCDHTHETPLPGRLGAGRFYTEMGKTKIFFYMTPRKDEISRQLVSSIDNNCIKMTTDVTTPPCPISEVSLMATKFPASLYQLGDSQGFDEDGRPIWIDPLGESIFNAYAWEVVRIAEEIWGFNVAGFSRDLSLIANHDAVKIHKDYFSQQYDFLATLTPPIPKYYLFQDLTLIDWSMAESSCTGTLLQDRESGDRFLMIMFPGEVFGAIYAEPVVDKGPDQVPTFPGPVAFPFHTALAPIDYFGCCNTGSWKGKRISATTRGVVLEDEIKNAMECATYLPIDRPTCAYDAKDYLNRSYPNGIVIKCMHTLPISKVGVCMLHPEKEHTTVLEEMGNESLTTAKFLRNELNLSGDLKHVFHITKRDGGFSKLSEILPKISNESTIVIINRSILPPGYKHFTLAEDCTTRNCPWIQMYWLPLSSVIKIPASEIDNILITPVEEIFFRDEIVERLNDAESVLNQPIVTKLDAYIFN